MGCSQQSSRKAGVAYDGMACQVCRAVYIALQVLRTAVSRAPAKEAAKAQAVLAPPLARAAMEPAPDVREAALQASVV